MTKALDDGNAFVPAPPHPPEILIWILPDAIAFQSNAKDMSKLFMARACGFLVRTIAEQRHREENPEGARLKKRAVADLAAELFIRAAEEVPITTVRQERRSDVAFSSVESTSTSILIYCSPLIVRSELERAAVFMLRATFRAMLDARVVLKPCEFQEWLEELACEARSEPARHHPGSA